jgi:hypothetical protein
MFLSQEERPGFTPIYKKGEIIILYFFIFIFSEGKLEDKRFCAA